MTDPYTILRAFVAAYKGDAIADSDLDDEQPRTITVTLGDIRRAQSEISRYESTRWPEGREFYELMQAYRHAPLTDPAATCQAYEAVKAWVRNAAEERA